jgi:hypothetical protein
MKTGTPRTQELRDDLAGIASEAPIWKLFKKLDCRQLERELTAVTEQRDRLAKALNAILNDDPDSPRYKIKEAQDALAAWKEARCES